MNVTRLYECTVGHPPYAYQRDLAESSSLPDLLTVPTGAGKTAAVVLAWVWRRRFGPPAVKDATPRRLVYCLPTRALVTQTLKACQAWIAAAGLEGEIAVEALMGGAVSRDWDEHPDAEQILVGTQDMLLSRALNRGYAMSAFRWPVQFAMLNNDALWVFDETQLMGVGLSTAAQLQALRDDLGTSLPSHSLFMSATNAPGRLQTVDFRRRRLTARSLSATDRAEPGLARRLGAPKPLSQLPLSHDDPKGIAAAIVERHRPSSLTLVVLNQVRRAQELFREISRLAPSSPVRLLHSRLRSADRSTAEEALRGDFHGILVATQVVEAGLDLSARVLVTDLAPWSAMVQRFGRCNRTGAYSANEAQALWIDLPSDGKHGLPYDDAQLDEARAHLVGLADVGIPTLDTIPEREERPALPVLRRRDLLELFDTEPDLAGHHIDVSRFVRDAEDRDVHVAWRAFPGNAAPPPGQDGQLDAEELVRVPVGALTKLLRRGATAWHWDRLRGEWQPVRRPAPGQTVLLSCEAGGYADDLGWTGHPKDRPRPVDLPVSDTPDADGDDRWSQTGAFVDLATHLSDTVAATDALARTLGSAGAPWDALRTAARWHDAGKVHAAFQEMLTGGRPEDAPPVPGGGPWAKSDRRGRTRCARPHFRHELVSALAWLADGGDDLTAYLIAAHHGKVRMHLRGRPTERPDESGRAVVLGVHDKEQFPGVDLGDGQHAPATVLDLSIGALGGGGSGTPSWHHRTTALLDAHGPFRLAMWESLVRIADWHASRLRAAPAPSEHSHD